MRSKNVPVGPVLGLAVGGLVIGLMASQVQAQAESQRGASSSRQNAMTPGSSDRCLSTPITNIEIVNASSLRIQDRSGRIATLMLSGPCLKDANEAVAIDLAQGRSSICRASDVEIVGNAATSIPLRCNVKSIRFD